MSELIVRLYPDKIVRILHMTSITLAILHYYSWIFLYHLSYYILGHRIKVLRLYLKLRLFSSMILNFVIEGVVCFDGNISRPYSTGGRWNVQCRTLHRSNCKFLPYIHQLTINHTKTVEIPLQFVGTVITYMVSVLTM